jgi:phosphate transport system protein
MTDPTGRHRTEALPEEQPRGLQEALPTDLDEHPLDQVPRPFTREALESELQEIKDGILRMGSLVAERTIAAVEALEKHDADGALAVIMSDVELNGEQARVTRLVTQTIARQQPVARDLRFLIALDHVAYDLERMGDHASSVAKQARKLAPHAPLQEHVRLPEMGRLVAQQVRDILVAVVDIDDVRARAVAKRDDEVDDLYHSIFDQTLDLMRADPDNVDPGARILFAAHYLERAGDRVTNIAEDIVFLATGQVEDLNP